MALTNFVRELTKLGVNDKDRAAALSVTTKSIERYRSGQLPKALRNFLNYPELLLALAEDAKGTQQKDSAEDEEDVR